MSNARSPPVAARLLQATLVLLGVGGVGGGVALLVDTSGALVGFPDSLLAGTPFGSYLLPGLLLLGVLGVLPLAVASGLATGRRYAWVGAVVVGCATVVWILVQVALVGYVSTLQPVVFGVGLVVLALALSGDVMAHYGAEAELDALVGR